MGITNPYGPVRPARPTSGAITSDVLERPPVEGVIDSRTFDFNDPANMTRPWGERGSITYRPNWGQPIVDGQWRGAQARQDLALQRPPTTDPREIIQQQHAQKLEMLQDHMARTQEELTRDSKYKLKALDREFDLKVEQLRARHFGPPLKEGETRQDREQAFNSALTDLRYNTELAKQRISDKIKPTLDALELERQTAAAQIQRDFEDRQLEIRRIDALQEKGVIKDPAVADRERFEIAGIKFSTADLRPPQADPYREMRRIDTLIQGLDEQIEELAKPFILGETDAEAAARKTDMQALVQQRNMLKDYKEKQLLPQIFPQFAEMFRRTGRIRSATTPVLPATGEPVGTIGTAVKKELEKTQGGARRQLDAATAQMLLQEAGGDKDKARQLAKSRGYKL